MKSLILASSLFAVHSFAADRPSALQIPLWISSISKAEGSFPASKINELLNSKGLELLPESIRLEVKGDSSKVGEELDEKIAKILTPLGEDYLNASRYSEDGPGQNDDRKFPGAPVTCFDGEAREIIEILRNTDGTFYSEQLKIIGWKHLEKTHVSGQDEEEKSDTESTLNQKSEVWKKWDPKNISMLIAYTTDDDGLELTVTAIPPCQLTK